MLRILVADDNTNIQKMVALALQDRGIDVTSVGNGEAAVRRLPDLNPDLILADIFMPVRNGYELCEWVKTDTKYSHIPVILLVGAFDPLDEKEARRVGADGVLKKPFIPPDPLIAMVTSALEKNPKIAAELAKAKEAPAPPPTQPPPAAAVEIAPKIDVKPLPEFPEPSTDDASLAYGFGTGRRGLDDEDIEESAAARAPKSDLDKEAEEEFEGSSTTKDWRRSAMEFEIPEEAARRIPFSSDEEIAAEFPSERNPVHAAEPADGIAPVNEQEVGPQVSLPWATQHESGDVLAGSADELPADRVSPEHTATSADEESAHIAQNRIAENVDPLAAQAPVGEPDPSSASRGSHWMDSMASTHGQSRGDWLSSLIASRTQQKASLEEGQSNLAAAPAADIEQPHVEGAHGEIDVPEARSQRERFGPSAWVKVKCFSPTKGR